MTVTDDETPERYQPEPRKWEDKDWLYEQYWGEWHDQSEIAEQVDVCQRVISNKMAELGIPTRREAVHRTAGQFGGYDPRDDYTVPDDADDTADWSIVVDGETVVDGGDDA